jgi:hypothetical protein
VETKDSSFVPDQKDIVVSKHTAKHPINYYFVPDPNAKPSKKNKTDTSTTKSKTTGKKSTAKKTKSKATYKKSKFS